MSQVLFVCVHNAGRSQMAQAFFNRRAEEQGVPLRAESVSTEPSEHVHPKVVDAMARLGLDISEVRPQLIADRMVQDARSVYTMGCGVDAATCPTVPDRDVEDWAVPDPAGKGAEETAAIRDLISEKVEKLVSSLVAGDG